MPFRVLRDPQQSLQQRMMIFEMLRRRGANPTPALDQFNQDLEEERRWRANQERLERGTEAEIIEGQERTGLAREKFDVDVDLGYKKNWREERETEGQVGLYGAQKGAAEAAAGAARALTGYREEQTQSEVDKRNRDNLVGILDDAEKKYNAALGRVASGQKLSRSDTDILERSQRVYHNSPSLALPRDEQGQWAPDVKRLIPIGKDGKPDAAFMAKLNELDSYKSEFGKEVGDFNLAKKNGADKETLTAFREDIKRRYLGTMDNEQTKIVDWMWNNDQPNLAMETMAKFKSSGATKVIIPSAAERKETVMEQNTLAQLNDLNREYFRLKKENKFPVGAGLTQTWNDINKYSGTIDPEVAAFIKNAEEFKGNYILIMTGLQYGKTEPGEITKRIPYLDDSPATFEIALPEYIFKLKRKLAIKNSYGLSIGLPPIPGADTIDLGQIMRSGDKQNELVPYGTTDPPGFVPVDMMKKHVMGVEALARKRSIREAQVGGVNEFRQSSEEDVSTEEGAEDPTAIYKDPDEAAELQRQIEEAEEAAATGRVPEE